MPKSNTCSQNKTSILVYSTFASVLLGKRKLKRDNSLLWVVFLVGSKIYTSEILSLPSMRILFYKNHTGSKFWAILINSIMVTENLLIVLPLFNFS